MNRPAFTELDRFGNSASSRWGARITNFLLHTQEGNGTAESLAGYLNNSANGVSYHYTVRDGVVCNVVDTDLYSWSVLDANSRTINLCFAGSRSSWSRQQWLAIDRDLRIAAWLAVEDARKYKFATTVITPPYRVADGISDHRYVTDALGIGDHTDVGPNFPWDVFASYVTEYAGGPAAAPVRNAIDDKAALSPWLGKRLTVGENTCPDKVGKWAQFERGYIYWSPASGAHPIPDTLWDKFAGLGWESGPLGYPSTDHTVLKGPDGQNWGDVQGFQGGAIYRRYSQPAFWVHGAIRDHWNRSGFETGPYGWPVSDEQPFDGAAFQDFEKGRIHWTPKPTLGVLAAGPLDTPLADVA